jgi:hypothetical protein
MDGLIYTTNSLAILYVIMLVTYTIIGYAVGYLIEKFAKM